MNYDPDDFADLDDAGYEFEGEGHHVTREEDAAGERGRIWLRHLFNPLSWDTGEVLARIAEAPPIQPSAIRKRDKR